MPDFINVPPWVTAALGNGSPQAPAPPALVPRTVETVHATPQNLNPIAAQPPIWTITISTGVVISVTGLGLIGRDPAPRQGEIVDHRIAVGNSEKSVSKTHLAFGVDNGQFWVEDRNSTNGTAIVSTSGNATPCEPGRPTVVQAGESVRFGELSFNLSSP